jgi:IS30 family transposase
MTGKHLTDEQRARVKQLRAEGMPATWIAEDIGCNAETARAVVQAKPEEVLDWRQSFALIRRNPELYALHRQFAPKPKAVA